MSLIDFLVDVELDSPRPDYRALIFWLTNRMPKRWTAKAQKDEPPADSEDDSQWCDDDWTV